MPRLFRMEQWINSALTAHVLPNPKGRIEQATLDVLAALKAGGYVIVPREPTESMLKAGEIPTRDIALGNGTFTKGLGLGASAGESWSRMIDASLE